jgi:integrase
MRAILNLKGINYTVKRLASGAVKTYWYAWRGGPTFITTPGEPDDAEIDAAFLAALNAAKAAHVPGNKGKPARDDGPTLQTLIDLYQSTAKFKKIAERTRRDYLGKIKLIEQEFGTMPLALINKRPEEALGRFLAWRDKLMDKSERQADYAFTVLGVILSTAKKRGKISSNPVAGATERVYNGSRIDKVWTLEQEAAFYVNAPAHLHLPLMLAAWTGQRQADLLRLTWSAYDGKHISLTPSKTKNGPRPPHLKILVGGPLKAMLDATPRIGDTILVNSEGEAWTEGALGFSGFRSSWRRACERAGIEEVTFSDLRGTAVTRLALAGASTAMIRTITGHSDAEVSTILDKHYLHRDVALGDAAIAKLEAWASGNVVALDEYRARAAVPGAVPAKKAGER